MLIGIPFCAKKEISGRIGNCQWTLDGTVLTISGNGSLDVEYLQSPWGKSITEVKINEGVTAISGWTFAYSKNLKKISLPSTLKTIGDNAFTGCSSLTSITLPEGVKIIDDYAFSECSSLLEITLSKTVEHIGFKVFNDCPSLTNIYVKSGSKAFISVDGILFSKDMKVLVRYPANRDDFTYIMPDGVEEISDGAFEGTRKLYEIELPDSIAKIGLNAFNNSMILGNPEYLIDECIYIDNCLILIKNNKATVCNIEKDTRVIADGAFMGCFDITQVTLPEGLLYIGEKSFAWCTSLESIYLPKSLKRINNDAFYYSNALNNVY
ncbi:MAG: leucine-rich repeat domain-containing protein, partial [Clostridia bacterium]|nr:leucine-rich repeat domain-containing protein [Clostridia bacterium]